MRDYVGDILDYAELDVEALEASGGTYDDQTHFVSWENVTIAANDTDVRKFQVTLIDPIPTTAQPTTLGADFDCEITNEYGNAVSLMVECPVVKGLETLPRTGAGSGAFIAVAMTGFVGYFFARARLLSKEIDIIRSDYAQTGGF